ncbi:hypothetical protein BDR26DRAFT_807710, partial [Obelidium mucronatum]
LRQFSPWGIDQIDTSSGWKAMKDISATEGLVAIPESPSLARVHQFAKLFLFSPVSALYTCPLAMTDGVRDPDLFIMSGQWTTEKPRGSDVGNTKTAALPDPTSEMHSINGTANVIKGRIWFSKHNQSRYLISSRK